ncbi:MAG: CYTH domain-containing protein [Candidatus Hodarchaeota archaeon]
MRRASKYLEIEATLLICTDKPLVLAQQVADLTSLATYQLQFKEFHNIHDFYFDTQEHALQSKKLTLRLREINSKSLITLKMPAHVINMDYGTQRSEMEYLWSKKALTKIINALNDQKIPILSSFPDMNEIHPLEIIKTLGLEIIQDRENFRKRRDIVIKEHERNMVLAELTIDSIIYHFSGQDIGHHEIEIELKNINYSTVLKSVVEHLISIYGSKLRIWPHSKLVTGKAIEKLWMEGNLDELLDCSNNLKPYAYNKIETYITRNMI